MHASVNSMRVYKLGTSEEELFESKTKSRVSKKAVLHMEGFLGMTRKIQKPFSKSLVRRRIEERQQWQSKEEVTQCWR